MQIEAEYTAQSADKSVSQATRAGEEKKFWYRSDRLIKVDNQWYFTTRESQDVGPFATREDAEHGLAIFIECVDVQKTSVGHAILTSSRGDWAVNFFH